MSSGSRSPYSRHTGVWAGAPALALTRGTNSCTAATRANMLTLRGLPAARRLACKALSRALVSTPLRNL
jgi:hypothetical protein